MQCLHYEPSLITALHPKHLKLFWTNFESAPPCGVGLFSLRVCAPLKSADCALDSSP